MGFQEILYDVKPDIIIECGTNRGGSALFMAHVCDIVGRGKIITIDIRQIANRPIHPRVEYLCGSTTSEETITRIKKKILTGDTVLVNLDSDHRMDHVLRELELYCSFVTKGSYLILEDTALNGNPIHDDGTNWAAGPSEALQAFLKKK